MPIMNTIKIGGIPVELADETARSLCEDLQTDIENLAEVARTGSYNDLSDKPTIPTPVTVIDNLTSSSTTSALSANQGKVLKNELGDDTLATAAQTCTGAINELKNSLALLEQFTYSGDDVTINSGSTAVITISDFSIPSGYSMASLPYSTGLGIGLLIASANSSGNIRIYNYGSASKTISSGVLFKYIFMKLS